MDENENDNGSGIMSTEGNPFMSADDAFSMALEMIKGEHIPRDKVYVWRQRYREGNLSHKKVQEILELAGYKIAIEEKWIFVPVPKKKSKKSSKEESEETPTEEIKD